MKPHEQQQVFAICSKIVQFHLNAINHVFFFCPVVYRDKWIYVQKGTTKEVSAAAVPRIHTERFFYLQNLSIK